MVSKIMKDEIKEVEENGIKYTVYYFADGDVRWCKSETGQLHRENGPAIENTNGKYFWYKDGKYHRDNGPACEDSDHKWWYKNGNLHREDGPAVEFKDGKRKIYALNDKRLENIKTDEELMIKLLLE